MSRDGDRLDDEISVVGFRVSGRVQGVSYRWFGCRAAEELGISGWIRNRTDGDVEGEAWGNPGALESFLRRLREGPPAAVVQRLTTTEPAATSSPSGFQIRR